MQGKIVHAFATVYCSSQNEINDRLIECLKRYLRVYN